MKDRSTESDAPTELERALLDAARSDCIPAELKARMAAGLITPPPTAASSAAQIGAPGGLGGLLFSKTSLWGTLAVALIALGGVSLRRHAQDPPAALAARDAAEQTAPTAPTAPETRPASGSAERAPAVGSHEDPNRFGAAETAPAIASQPVSAANPPRRPRERTLRSPVEPRVGTRTPAERDARASREAEPQSPAPAVDGTSSQSTERQAERPTPISRGSGTSALRAELLLLDRARDALRSGSTAQALLVLDEHAARFAHGALAPEADALAIETLLLSGARARAAQRAERFLQRHAGHPLAAQIERWRDGALQ